MNNFNFSVLEGNLVGDPKISQLNNGISLCTFTIGSNRTYIKKNGEKVEEAHFFDITTWSRLGEICNKYLKKGSRVLVSGMLKKSSWKNTQGEVRTRTYLEGRDVNFLSPVSRR